MNLVQDFFHTVYNVPELIRIVGQFGLPVIIFAETGLLIGFFLPGDSLLITAGAGMGVTPDADLAQKLKGSGSFLIR